MKLNLGMGMASGNPGSRNDRGGKKQLSPSTAGISANLAKSQAKGKPGARNPRSGDVVLQDATNGNAYGGKAGMRGDKAVFNGAQRGAPGVRNERRGRVQKTAMYNG